MRFIFSCYVTGALCGFSCGLLSNNMFVFGSGFVQPTATSEGNPVWPLGLFWWKHWPSVTSKRRNVNFSLNLINFAPLIFVWTDIGWGYRDVRAWKRMPLSNNESGITLLFRDVQLQRLCWKNLFCFVFIDRTNKKWVLSKKICALPHPITNTKWVSIANVRRTLSVFH